MRRSARRPVQLALAEHVHVDVMHGLPAQVIAVHHHAEPLRASLLHGQALGGVEDVPGQGPVIFGELVEAGDVALGDDQEMHRRLRADVMEGQHLVVLVQRAAGISPATMRQNRQSMRFPSVTLGILRV